MYGGDEAVSVLQPITEIESQELEAIEEEYSELLSKQQRIRGKVFDSGLIRNENRLRRARGEQKQLERVLSALQPGFGA